MGVACFLSSIFGGETISLIGVVGLGSVVIGLLGVYYCFTGVDSGLGVAFVGSGVAFVGLGVAFVGSGVAFVVSGVAFVGSGVFPL